jgi:hypothetical protein
MSKKIEKIIVVDAELSINGSEDLRQVSHQAKAGVSNSEAIERNIVGEYNEGTNTEEGDEEEG